MLRADVDDVLVAGEELVLLDLQVAVLVEEVLQTVVGLHVVLQRIAIVKLPVLAEGIALEIAAQEEAAHVGMAQEDDAVEVIDLALQQVSHAPDVRNGRQIGNQLTVSLSSAVRGDAIATHLCLGQHLHAATLMGIGILKNVDTAETFFTEVLANNGDKIVKALLVLQVLHLLCELVKIE